MKKLAMCIILCLIGLTSYSQLDTNSIDDRVLKYYSTIDCTSMDSLKYEQINYYYCDSYSYPSGEDVSGFDITEYEYLRKESSDVTITYNSFNIVLFARESLTFTNNYNRTDSKNIIIKNR